MDTTAIAISLGLPWLVTSIVMLTAIVVALMDLDCVTVEEILHVESVLDEVAFRSNRTYLVAAERKIVAMCVKIDEMRQDFDMARRAKRYHLARYALLVATHNHVVIQNTTEVVYRLTA